MGGRSSTDTRSEQNGPISARKAQNTLASSAGNSRQYKGSSQVSELSCKDDDSASGSPSFANRRGSNDSNNGDVSSELPITSSDAANSDECNTAVASCY